MKSLFIPAARDTIFPRTSTKTGSIRDTAKPKPEVPLRFGPNIIDWPAMSALPDHLCLIVASVITDPVTTTDELIPRGRPPPTGPTR